MVDHLPGLCQRQGALSSSYHDGAHMISQPLIYRIPVCQPGLLL
ncbi:hypothetical protein KNP414_06469 [Paenibacillus mucilaginosus KNP414]|uniref:Uncharacterized protein n=1 Tax=Paenibacillus mucilaginosus (strain KNP414) TaxID=1036673 RepID=F8FNS1_PAEMK|nr:hypothetical protein KNP414_06469 [Paenibacillus mucilaginosus KNP414]